MDFKINKNITILSLAFLFIFLGYASIQQYVTSYFLDQGKVDVGFMSLILIYLFFAISNFFSALFISKYGEKKAILIGSLFYSAYIFSLLSNSNIIIYIFSALLGIGAALLWIGQSNYLIKASKDTHYGRNSGVFSTIQLSGSAIGLIALGILIKYFSFRLSFLIYAFFPLIGFILLFKLKNLKTEKKNNSFSLIKETIKNKIVLRLSLIWFAFHFAFGISVGVIPIHIKNSLSIVYIGILSSLFYLFPIIFSYLIGHISDKFGRKRVVIFSYITSIFGLLFLYFYQNVFLLILGVVFLAFNSAIVKTINSPLIGDFSNKNNVQFLTAFFWVVQQIGVVTSLFLAKSMQDKNVYLIAMAGILVSLTVILPLFKRNFSDIKETLSREIK